MRKSVAVSRRAAVPPMRRVWFVCDGGFENSETFQRLCEKRGWDYLQSFDSWNDFESGLGMAMDRHGQVVIFGSIPCVQHLTLAEACEFLAAMCHESQGGTTGSGKADFYRTIAAKIGGAK